jgi:hypothetical protein
LSSPLFSFRTLTLPFSESSPDPVVFSSALQAIGPDNNPGQMNNIGIVDLTAAVNDENIPPPADSSTKRCSCCRCERPAKDFVDILPALKRRRPLENVNGNAPQYRVKTLASCCPCGDQMKPYARQKGQCKRAREDYKLNSQPDIIRDWEMDFVEEVREDWEIVANEPER